MPGNEFGDRIHNFFGQENLRQGQYQLQAADGNWSGLNNNQWVGSQRQIGAASTSNLKSYNAYQSAEDPEGGHGDHSFHTPHGLNLLQSNIRAEFGRTPAQNQQPTLNGYVQGHHIFQTRQNESNFMEVDPKPVQNLTSRGLSIHEGQQINGAEHNNINSFRLESADSPVSFDFFGGQQQMYRGHLSMMQHLPRQQSGVPDMQLLQQQAVLAQIRELQRQQQLEQLEARNHSSMNQISSIAKQTAIHQSPAMINRVAVNEVSNYPWQPEQMTSNVSWLQRGASPVMQGPSSGLMFPSEQNQAMRSIGLITQQVDQSLYGVPVSTTVSIPGPNSLTDLDKPVLQQLSDSNNSSLKDQYPGFLDRLSLKDGASVLRQDFHGKNMFALTDGQGLNGGLNSENLRQVNSQQSNAPAQDVHGRQEADVSSEMLQERTVMQVSPSQNLATLDPTEEKILYGSDDNLWDAFGRTTNMGSGGYNMLDGSDFYNGLPSLQSGPWSALMQSAVAETSSGDVGTQEEWNGFSFQNAEPSNGNQLPAPVNDGGKLQPLSVDSNSQTVSTLKCRSSSISADTYRPNAASANNAPTFQQPGLKPSFEHSEGVKTDSGQRFTSQFLEGGSKWLGHRQLQKPLADGSHISGSINHSPGAEINTNNISGSWTSQQNISSYSDSQQFKPNGWNFIKSMSSDGGDTPENHENQGLWQTPKGGDEKRAMHEDMSNTSVMCKMDSVMNPDFESPALENHQFCNEGSMNNDAAIPNFCTLRADEESRQHHPDSRNIPFWKDVDSSVKSQGNSFPVGYQHHLNNKPQILESSLISAVHKGAAEMHETMTSDKNENSNDGFRSSISPHVSSGGLRENHLSDATEARTFPRSKQKSSFNSSSRKPSLTRKFQYHPMGNLDVDVEPSYETKHEMQSWATTQQQPHVFESHDQGSSGQSKSGHTDRNYMEVEKSDTRGLGEVPSKRMLPGFLPAKSVSFNDFVGNDIPDKNQPSSQNILELLQKVDQPKDCDTATQISPSNQYLSSEMSNVESSDGPVRTRQNQSSSSHGFGLQLGPPSQRFLPGPAQSSPSSSQTVQNSSYATSEMGEKGHTWLSPAASIQSFPNSCDQSQGDFRNSTSVLSGHLGNKGPHSQGSFSAGFGSSFPHSLSRLQNQHKILKQSDCVSSERIGIHSRQLEDSCQRVETSQPTVVPDISRSAPQISRTSSAEASQLRSAGTSQLRNPAQQLRESGSESVFQQVSFSKGSPNAWANVVSQQRLPGAQPSNAASDLFKCYLQSDNNFERSSFGPKKLDGQDIEEVGTSPTGACSVNPQNFVGREQPVREIHQVTPSSSSQGKGAIRNHLSEASPPNLDATQKDIEAFGHSLGPSSSWNQQLSLLHQMQAMKSSETDPRNCSEKRIEGPDCGVDPLQIPLNGAQQLSYLNKVREASLNHTSSISSGDPQMPSFFSKPGDSRDGFHNSSHNISTGNIGSCGGEYSQVSPLMAPSWFDQYGTFKNGQEFSAYAGHKNTPVKPMDPPLIVRKPLDSLSAPDSLKPAGNAVELIVANQNLMKNFSSNHMLPSDITDQSLVVMRSKKRKSSAPELFPWHKELAQGSQQLQTISMADLDWAQAANRLVEKMEDETEMIEDGSMMLRPKKRLILTTQLMQQLLRPPPQAVLSADSISLYDSVAYIVARLALRDACTADTALLPDSGNPLPGKLKPSAKIGDHKFTKVMEEFVGRARELENEFLRMDKRASILDLRVEFQDLEKFSVINRFAKFHGRGQADGSESSSSSYATATSQKYCLHRYVTALPMPRNLPDGVQCLSL